MSPDSIPSMGLGTWGRSGPDGLAAIRTALEIGYRHIDTAQSYDTERNVGEALRQSGLRRDEVFITTKVARLKLAKKDFLPSVYGSLETIGVERLDMLLIHWPSADPSIRFEDYVEDLGEAKRRGLTRHIGVSNFPNAHTARAVEILGEGALSTNQVEMHPFLQNRKVLEACRRHAMRVTAYMPLAQGRVARDPMLLRIGKAHGALASQVSLAWLLALGAIVIPASSKPEHLRSNFAALKVKLSESDMAEIGALDRGERIIDPADAPDWD